MSKILLITMLLLLSPMHIKHNPITTKIYNFDSVEQKIKKLSFNSKLSKAEIFELLSPVILKNIEKNKSKFKCSEKSLQIAITSMICLETGNLRSKSIFVNNLIGIKSVKNRPKILFSTTEYINGKLIHINQYFAVFYSFDDCIQILFRILQAKRYKKVRTAKSLDSLLYEIGHSGYATDPNHYEKLKRIAVSFK